jgi:hypothetical protein
MSRHGRQHSQGLVHEWFAEVVFEKLFYHSTDYHITEDFHIYHDPTSLLCIWSHDKSFGDTLDLK